jgi:hypothetical protein
MDRPARLTAAGFAAAAIEASEDAQIASRAALQARVQAERVRAEPMKALQLFRVLVCERQRAREAWDHGASPVEIAGEIAVQIGLPRAIVLPQVLTWVHGWSSRPASARRAAPQRTLSSTASMPTRTCERRERRRGAGRPGVRRRIARATARGGDSGDSGPGGSDGPPGDLTGRRISAGPAR